MMQARFSFSACTAKRGVGIKQRNTRPQTAIGSREPLGCPKETAFLMGRCFVRLADDRVQRFFLGQHTSFSLEPDGGGRPASLQSEMQCLFLLLCLRLHRKTTENFRNLAAASGLERRAATPPQMCAEATAQSVGEVLLFTENKRINSSTKIDKSRPGEYGRIRVDLVRFSCGRREFFVEKRSLPGGTCQKFQRSIHQL